MFQYLPLPTMEENLDSARNMSPCIVMKDDGICCQQVSSLCPECWMKMITLVQHSRESDDTCWQQTPSFFITIQGLILLMLSRISFATGDLRYWSIRHTHPI
jgi:hypothetical protein